MLQPARRKYRKEQKGRNKGIATRGAKVSFGDFGLKAIGRGRLTARQIEAARRAISRRVFLIWLLLVNCWVADCMRKENWALSRSANSLVNAAPSLARNSLAFMIYAPT